MKFGAKLKELRDAAGLTQDELALKIDVAKSTISLYENEKRDPNTSIMMKFAEFFGITLDELVGNVTFENSPKIVLYGADGKLVDISMLSQEDQEYILSLAERLKNKR
jgi:transcriptional regulator with XRE-family HTH domain